ncbi:hypothetical protein GCM10027341_24670 [Spirosoma knui]
MKTTKVVYWILTGLMAAVLGLGSIFDAMSAPEAVAHVTQLGYPAYLVPFLGVAKLLGIVAILIPGYQRLKEWAYAGLLFDLIGAIYSHVSVGAGLTMGLPLLILVVLVISSYVYYHKLARSADVNIPQSVRMAGVQ